MPEKKIFDLKKALAFFKKIYGDTEVVTKRLKI
jgi:hypothetical protein